MKIILIGFMGAGKSTVAKQLSKLLSLPFIDTDALVCQATKTQNIHEVFAMGGELLLRETEIRIAKQYASWENIIISAGGGMVLNKITIDYLKTQRGKVFFLNTSFDLIAKRLAKDSTRPLFNDLIAARALYDFRLPLYLHYADQTINTDPLLPDEIAHQIKEIVTNGL